MSDYSLPPNVTKNHQAILGTNGSGKTSVAKRMIVEPSLAAGERNCIIDPTGVWHGLRLGANGKPKGGFLIYIVGGAHADFPLNSRDGKLWAEIVGTSADSFIFDVSQMTVADRTRWFTDFAEALIIKNRGPLRLIIDEAHLFAPQGGARSGGLAPDMLHATNNLLALGRSKGLRVTMISQRAAKLHKDSLSQAHTLIALKLVSPQDRNAIKEWVADQTDPATGKDLLASLPALKPGEGWIWAPGDGILERVKFPRPTTYDSSRAPEEGEGDGPVLPKIDPYAISGRLAQVAAEAKANDPKAMAAEIARLKAEVAKAPKPASPEVAASILMEAREAGRIEGFDSGVASMQRGALAATDNARERLTKAVGEILGELGAAVAARKAPYSAPEAPRPRTAVKAPQPRPAAPPPPHTGDLERPLQTITDAVRWWNVMGIKAPSHPQVAFIAGYSHKSGTWSTYLSKLRSAGILEGRGDLTLTDLGESLAREPDAPPSGERLREIVLSKIDTPLAKILRPILAAYPDSLDHATVADEAGYSSKSGTWSTYLSKLRSLALIEGRGALAAQDWLFPHD